MKNLYKLWVVLFVLCLFSNVQAQEKERTIKIKIQKEVNGEMTTVEKTYGSIEEMKNDPDLKDMNIKMLKGGGNFFFSDDKDGKLNITIKEGEGGETHKNHFFYKIDGTDDFDWKEESHEIEVTKDDDGNVTILRNGKPVDKDKNVVIQEFHSNDIDDIEHIKVKKSDDGSKIIIINGDKEIELNGNKEIEENVEVLVNSFHNAKEGDQNVTSVKIVIRKVKIHIEDVAKEDEALKALNLDNQRELKLQELKYYPNPTDGRFNLSFQGKAVPTEIRITNLTGNTIFSDVISDFEGYYNNEIDLNDQAKGVYIMQVIQGKRTMNKKIVIE